MLARIDLDKFNRMLRFGFGKNKGKWFVRIDLWWVGFRLTGNRKEKKVDAPTTPTLSFPTSPHSGEWYFFDDRAWIYMDDAWHLIAAPSYSTQAENVIPELDATGKPFTSADLVSGEIPSSLDEMGREFK